MLGTQTTFKSNFIIHPAYTKRRGEGGQWPKVPNIPFHTYIFTCLLVQEWYTGFKKDCPSGQLTPDKFIAMYSQVALDSAKDLRWPPRLLAF